MPATDELITDFNLVLAPGKIILNPSCDISSLARLPPSVP